MKKLMLSAFVAVLALASCNKQDTVPVKENMKSVEISLTNVKFETKGPGLAAGSELKTNDKIQLNTVQIFFSDGSRLYKASNADGSAATAYFADASAATGAALSFHFLPPAVNKVIVVGNHAEITTDSEAQLDLVVKAAEQQDVTNLVLYDESALVAKTPDHNSGANAHNTQVYSATVTLVPKIARFEILNFACDFSTPPLYNSIEILQVHFADRYDQTTLKTNTLGDLHNMDLTSESAVFSHLSNHSVQSWYNDLFDPAVQLTTAAPSAASNLAYNFIPSTELPRFVLRLTTDNANPAYLYTKSFVTDGGATLDSGDDFEAGKIYRITDFRFKDTDLTHQERCVEIVLKVLSWEVVYVAPVF